MSVVKVCAAVTLLALVFLVVSGGGGCGSFLPIDTSTEASDDASATVTRAPGSDSGVFDALGEVAITDAALEAESASPKKPTGERCESGAGTCIIDCTQGDCVRGVQCPIGRDCLFRCADGMCPLLWCAPYQRCIIDCPGDPTESCRGSSYQENSASSVCIRCGSCVLVGCPTPTRSCVENLHVFMPNGCNVPCSAPSAPECEP